MATQPLSSRIAALYERQDDPRHPLGWTHHITTRITRSLVPSQETPGAGAVTPGQAMLRGAQKAATNPLWLPLTLPSALILLGGAAPAVACTLSATAALTLGTTGLMGSGLRRPHGTRMAAETSPGRPYTTAIKTCVALGIAGCLTELVALQLGRWGARQRQSQNAAPIARGVGHVAEHVGYGVALAVGASLAIGRLVATAALLAIMGAVQLPAAVIGGLWSWSGRRTANGAGPASAQPLMPPSSASPARA